MKCKHDFRKVVGLEDVLNLPEVWKVEMEEDPYLPKEWNILATQPQPQPPMIEKVINISHTQKYWSKLEMQIYQQL